MVRKVPRGSFDHGSKSGIGVTAVVLSSTPIDAKRGVLIKAASANSGIVYVGTNSAVTADSNDTSDGFPLSAGDSVEIEIDDAAGIFLIASEAGQKVFWIGV